jgi:glycosyltransferase involved in cell wall biosynthesis
VMAWTAPSSWERFYVVHCGLEPERFPVRPPLPEGPLRMLAIGRFDPVKGYTVLLEACRNLSDRGVEWLLDLVGDGELLGHLQGYARQLGIAEHVRFSGAIGQEQILEHFRKADVLVVSSFMEGIPVVLMEALAMGLGVVATDVAGVRELVVDGESGLLVRPGSAQALSDALARLAGDRKLRESLGTGGRRRVMEDFGIDNVADSLLRLFAPVARDEPAEIFEQAAAGPELAARRVAQ